MNILYEVIFEQEINGKTFRMNVTSGSTYQECHDFCVEVMKKVMELADQDNKKREERQAEQQEQPASSQ